MTLSRLVHPPTDRRPPEDILRGLREVDPLADLTYMGRGRWLVGTVRPGTDRRREAQGRYTKAQALRAIARHLAQNATKNANAIDYRSLEQLWYAELKLQGFVWTVEWVFAGPRRLLRHGDFICQGDPDGRIVEHFRAADWWVRRNVSEQQFETDLFAAIDAPQLEARAAARRDLTDDARARAAYKYAFTRQHPVTWYDDPLRPRGAASGRTRHPLARGIA